MGDTGTGTTPTGGSFTPRQEPPPPPPPPAPTAATGSIEVIPIRGGKHHAAYGMFIGGSPLNDNYYQPTREARLRYRAYSQRRNMKTIGSIESAIIAARDSTTSLKFDGHPEPSVGTPVTEIGKDRFITLLSRNIRRCVIVRIPLEGEFYTS